MTWLILNRLRQTFANYAETFANWTENLIDRAMFGKEKEHFEPNDHPSDTVHSPDDFGREETAES